MTNDLREIAKQIIDCENGSACWWDSDGPESGPAYAVKLARAYLAEHPEDDEPVAEWWSQRIGETSHIVKWSPVQLWIEFDDQLPHVVKDNPTRGDVRRLLAALGIEVRK
jgi:hypothetical protein